MTTATLLRRPPSGTRVHPPAGGPSGTGLDADWQQVMTELGRAVAERVATVEAVNTEAGQHGRSWSLPVALGVGARVPVWTSRRQWQHQVRTLLAAGDGGALCRGHRVAPVKVLAYATAWSLIADSATGRGVTESRGRTARRAGLGESVARRARRVLRDLGVAVELVRGRYLSATERDLAAAHHGGRQRRAASVWALTTPHQVATTVPRLPPPVPRRTHTRAAAGCPQTPGRDPLPQRGCSGVVPSVSAVSPTRTNARRRAPRVSHHDRNQEPRALQTQHLAADLARRVPALTGDRHIGVLCDVLADCGVDGSRWSGRDVQARLDADTKARGWSWPAQLTNPSGFLRHRLAQLDWTEPSPSETGATQQQARAAQQAQARAERAAVTPPASAEARAAARAAVAAQLGPGAGRIRSKASWAAWR